MLIDSFGYAGIRSMKLDDWVDFGRDILGLQLAERTKSSLVFRVDDRKQRIVVEAANADRACIYGWEVADKAALDRLAATLDKANVAVKPMDRIAADQRMVAGGIVFNDPAGNTLEAFHGPEISPVPFTPGRTMSGFRTGPMGLGHCVLGVERLEEVMPFYTDVLGFQISDWMHRPFTGYFLHINQRHHSLGLFQLGRNNCHHLMVEALSLDDVGQCYDLATAKEGTVNVTLGRHSNDFMTSFYANSPSGFLFECGWGGRELEMEGWEPFELTHGASLWGHDRAWQSLEMRAETREQRLRAAHEGMREPVHVMRGNYKVGGGFCPWWDGVKQDAH